MYVERERERETERKCVPSPARVVIDVDWNMVAERVWYSGDCARLSCFFVVVCCWCSGVYIGNILLVVFNNSDNITLID